MNKQKCTLTVNGKSTTAFMGETLLDAALGARMVLPHDCCSGQCESCRVRLISGQVDDFGSRQGSTVLGCISQLEGDAEIAFDPVPPVRRYRGRVERIEAIGFNLLQVSVRTFTRATWLPGQYVRVWFSGFPSREYSPTFPLDLGVDPDVFVFHIKVYPSSKVSSQIGNTISVGHLVTVDGPFGQAYLRRQDHPLLLTSTGTGFAPIWAIAVAAVKGQPHRPMRLIVGARYERDLYMRYSTDWLVQQNVSVTLTASDGDPWRIRKERPADLIGAVHPDEVVYAAGSSSHVDAVRLIAATVTEHFYADPFLQAANTSGWQRFFGSNSHNGDAAVLNSGDDAQIFGDMR